MSSPDNSASKEKKEKTFSKILPFILPFKWHIIGLVVITALIAVMGMVPPLLTRAVINKVLGDGETSLLPGLAVVMLSIPVLHAVMSYTQVIGIAYVGQMFVLKLRMAVYKHFLSLHVGYFSKNSTGKLVNRLMGDSSVMQQILNVASVQVISDLICSLFAISAMLYINWRLTLPIIFILILFVINFNVYIDRIRNATQKFRSAEDRVAGGVQNRLAANLTVKTYGTETREQSVFDAQTDTSMGLQLTTWIASSTLGMNTVLLQDTGRTCIYFLGCAMVLFDSASYGDVTAFTAYAMQILWPAVRFSMLVEQLQNIKISAVRLFEILDEKPEVCEKPEAITIDGKMRGDVELDRVVFGYNPEKVIINDISLKIPAGTNVALVGHTGCGKTTILSLIMRLFDVQNGFIKIDGVDVRDFKLHSLRKQFGIVLQESLLFQISIADNIRYAKPDATMAEIVNAAKIAEIHNDIMRLRNGYDSIIGDKDVQLSVGQNQRISIARATLANPAIIIMDEATSSLDSESEQAIQLAMEKFLVGRTSFIVAHRLSTIKNADCIILLDNGKICEMGNHHDLMKIPNGNYRDLYEKHSGKGIIFENEDK